MSNITKKVHFWYTTYSAGVGLKGIGCESCPSMPIRKADLQASEVVMIWLDTVCFVTVM